MEISPSFLLMCLLIELTPGPNMTFLALLSIGRGRKAALKAVLGTGLGLLLLGISIFFGLGKLIEESKLFYEGLRWAGIVFLLYLAFDAWKSDDQEGEQKNLRHYFWQGLFTNLLNPKAALFYVTVFPSFILPSEHFLADAIYLTAIYVTVATAIHVAIVLIATRAMTLFASSVTKQRIRIFFALSLCGVALWLFFATKR